MQISDTSTSTQPVRVKKHCSMLSVKMKCCEAFPNCIIVYSLTVSLLSKSFKVKVESLWLSS